MTDLRVTQASMVDTAAVYDTLVSAFVGDPVERWLYPDLGSYNEHFRRFLEAFGGRAFEAQTVWCLSDFSAVALWLPPGIEPDGEAIEDVLTGSVASTQQADTFAVLEQMGIAHPTEPHWYLPWLGVEERFHGRGHGTALLSACLITVDATHLPAYLETPNPVTIAFYERHGFHVTGSAQAGTCPPITFMLRPAH